MLNRLGKYATKDDALAALAALPKPLEEWRGRHFNDLKPEKRVPRVDGVWVLLTTSEWNGFGFNPRRSAKPFAKVWLGWSKGLVNLYDADSVYPFRRSITGNPDDR